MSEQVKKKTGRPLADIDEEQVRELASMNCSLDEIAAVVRCEKTTLHRRFAMVIEEGRKCGRSSLKRRLWELAMAGNTQVAIWLSRNMLGYTDRSEIVIDEKVKEFAEKAEKVNQLTNDQLITMTQKLLNDLIQQVVKEKEKQAGKASV
jgi:AraC-like DNA-binding protein